MVTHDTPRQADRANVVKLDQLKRTIDRLAGKVLRQGFFGTVAIEFKVQDGVIQNITSRVEENVR